MTQSTRLGSTIAGYRVLSVLGQGGMSVVYLAEHLRLGRKVALKVLAAPLALDRTFRERFVRESQRAAELDHPNVIPIYDAGEVEEGDAKGTLYIAMRHVAGADLKSILAHEGPPPVGRTLFLLEQVAAGLDAAHRRDLVHRDVKPANVLVEPSDHVFLTDFGIAKQTTAAGMTETGVFVGTLDYAAPEQIEGLPLDGRTDVYALGCVLYECLTGRPPFEREADVGLMRAHLAEPPPRVSDRRPDLPRALDAVVQTAMAKEKDARYATAPELVAAARAAALGGETRVVERPVRGRNRRLLWPLAAALAAAAAAAAAILLLTGGDGPTRKAPDGSALERLVPAVLWEECSVQDEPAGAASVTAVCYPSGVRAPEAWELSLYATREPLVQTYENERLDRGYKHDSGMCDENGWSGEWTWDRDDGSHAGRHLCYRADGEVRLLWTIERNPGGLLASARKPGTSHAGLFDWWMTWKDRIGRPRS